MKNGQYHRYYPCVNLKFFNLPHLEALLLTLEIRQKDLPSSLSASAAPPVQGEHCVILTKQVYTTILTEITLFVNLFFGQFCRIKQYLTSLRRQAEKSVTYQHKCS